MFELVIDNIFMFLLFVVILMVYFSFRIGKIVSGLDLDSYEKQKDINP